MQTPFQRSRSRRRGASLVEFALVFPLFMTMVFFLVDVGRYYLCSPPCRMWCGALCVMR
ncbi:MAG: pilus assembly protein [Blastochloris sp.]|nr:pilus assembly protein [Blastochloris sp.]